VPGLKCQPCPRLHISALRASILIGSKAIITPAARDLAAQHDVFTIAE
jgi:hypothetical protein